MDLLEHILVVVAGLPVGPYANGYAGLQEAYHVSQSARQLQIAGRIMGHAHAGSGQQFAILLGDVYAVCGQNVRIE